jgi:radical SAM protein with 4Fe4S-binding SPASM domain
MHCYNSSESNHHNNQLNTDQAKELLSQLAEANCPVVLFSGGEPLMRHDLFELLTEAKRLRLRTVISTNGTLINSDIADTLAEVGVSYVGISLDGQEDFHDKFRASKGCFKAAIDGIENCKNAGLKTGLRFTITKENHKHVPVIFDIASSNSVRRICFYHLIRTGRAKQLKTQALTPVQTRQTIDTIIEKTRDFVQKSLINEVLTVGNHADGPYLLTRMIKEKNKSYEKARKLLLINGGNKIGEKIACISSDGSVHADQFWHNYSLGNIKEKTFAQIWQNQTDPVLAALHNKAEFADKRCLTCRWFDLCRGNFRFLTPQPDPKNWLNEPSCYLTDSEIAN